MVGEERVVELLKRVPLFSGLTDRQLKSLVSMIIERPCAAGEIIVPQDEEGLGFFMIAAGAAEAVRLRADGSSSVVNTFGPGDYFGELALLDKGPRTASVVAVEETDCLILPRVNFLHLMRREGDIGVEIMIELAKRFRSALEAY